jgi:hypothetical protein
MGLACGCIQYGSQQQGGECAVPIRATHVVLVFYETVCLVVSLFVVEGWMLGLGCWS